MRTVTAPRSNRAINASLLARGSKARISITLQKSLAHLVAGPGE